MKKPSSRIFLFLLVAVSLAACAPASSTSPSSTPLSATAAPPLSIPSETALPPIRLTDGLGTIGSMLLTVGLMAFEATRDWFNLVPLSWQEWLMVLGTASTGLWLILPEWFSVFWPWLKRTLGKRAEAKA